MFIKLLYKKYIMNMTLPALRTESGLTKYLDDIKKFPILSIEDENNYASKWFEVKDLLAAHILVTSHLRLVVKVAMQFKGYGLPIMDIISEGNIGLMVAVKKFNPHLGHRLATYAIWWIKATIQDYILKSWSLVKMGTSSMNKKLFFNLRKIKNKLLHANNGQVLGNESEIIANELDVSKFDVELASKNFDSQYDSLNSTFSSDDAQEAINLVVEPADNQEILLIESDNYKYRKNKFDSAFNLLDDRERYVIESRKLQDKPVKLKILSQELGVSNERVRQIEDRAMRKIITYVKSDYNEKNHF